MKVSDLPMGFDPGRGRNAWRYEVLEFFSARGYRETRGEETDCSVAGDDSFWRDQGQDFLLINLAVQSVLLVLQSVKIRVAFFLGRSCSLTATSH
jgi:hypothetical protein